MAGADQDFRRNVAMNDFLYLAGFALVILAIGHAMRD